MTTSFLPTALLGGVPDKTRVLGLKESQEGLVGAANVKVSSVFWSDPETV